MAALYPATSVFGYNANPPPDDGTTVATNLITWAGIKSKVGDPLNTFAGTVDSNLTAAFGKTLDGASVVSTGVSYAMTAADQGRLIKATASGITITTPDAGTVLAPFTFAVSNQSTSAITIAGNATNAQTIDGVTTQVLRAGSGCIVKTDGTNWFTFGLKPAQLTAGTNPLFGFDVPINLQINASVASNLLTVALKTNSGNDPSVSDPVLIPFRDTTLGNGDPIWVSVTSALSINTNAAGATLGTANGVPFRFWIVAFNNAGTAVLALWHSGAGSSGGTSIAPINESKLASTTAISAAATGSATFYTPNGTSLSSCAFRIIGFLEYPSGLATAGSYASLPNLQLFGTGIKKPGDISQIIATSSSSQLSITINSQCNLILVQASGTIIASVTGSGVANLVAQLKRGSTLITSSTLATSAGGTYTLNSPFGMVMLDNPQVNGAVTYSVVPIPSGTAASGSNTVTSFVLTELVG